MVRALSKKAQRYHRRIIECAIGVVEHLLEIGQARIAFEIGAHDEIGGVGIVAARKIGNRRRRKFGPSLRQIEAAIAR